VIACVDDIKTRIETVRNKTDDSIIDEVKINQYLDAILTIQRKIDSIVVDIDNLVEDVNDFFNKNPSPELFLELKPSLESLCKTASKCYIRARKSKYYAGAKTSIKEFHLSISGLSEIIHDLELFLVKLPNDDEYKEIVNKINGVLA